MKAAAPARSTVLSIVSSTRSPGRTPVDLRMILDDKLVVEAFPDPIAREIFRAETDLFVQFMARKYKTLLFQARRQARAEAKDKKR